MTGALREATLGPVAVRTFIALPATELAESLSPRLERWRDLELGWVPPVNWHVTLRFLGETDPARLEGLLRLLEVAAKRAPLELRLEAVGWFPSDRRRVALAASVAEAPQLTAMQAVLERGAVELGFTPEARRFHPHLTLARPRRRRPAPDFARLRLDLRVPVRELVLYQSVGTPEGVRYRSLVSTRTG